ncbi:hypothetical protein QF028_005405 [Neobacillus sp. B4I6]
MSVYFVNIIKNSYFIIQKIIDNNKEKMLLFSSVTQNRFGGDNG